MKICFLWVDHFKKLVDFSINLSSDYHYSYNDNTQTLKREVKPTLPKNFWGEHISDVSGILGVNGAGKTTMLELLCLAVKANEITSRYLIVYEKDNRLYYVGSDDFKCLKTDLEIHYNKSREMLNRLGIVFFSNVFDESYMELGEGVQDVSVNNKVVSERRGSINSFNQQQSRFMGELLFVLSGEFSALKYNAPEKISFKLNSRFWSKYLANKPSENTFPAIDAMRDIYLRSSTSQDLFRTCLAIQLTLLSKLFSEYVGNTGSEVVAVFEKLLNYENDNLPDIEELISELISVLESGERSNFKSKDKHFLFILRDLQLLKQDLISNKFLLKKEFRSHNLQFTLEFDPDCAKSIERIARIISLVPSGDIEWAEMSSGQRAYINLFSSIWNAIHRMKEKSDGYGDDTLICIDEGDLYLHPQLQLQFIEKLVNVLPQLARGKVQIIVTTHSPLLITEFPAQSVVILTKEQNNRIITRQGENTYGGNIYDIYRNAFGVVGQRTGNLSDKYISKIVEILDKGELTDADIIELDSSLSVIGDKLLRYHIKKRISTKVSTVKKHD